MHFTARICGQILAEQLRHCMRELLEKNAARQILSRPVRQHFLCTGKADCAQWGATAHPGQSHNIERKRKMLLRQACSNFAAILQNPPFPRGRRYRRVFAAHILEYVPRKNAPLPCPHEKIANFAKFPQKQPPLTCRLCRLRSRKKEGPFVQNQMDIRQSIWTCDGTARPELSRPVFLYKPGARMYKRTFINYITIP